ncbi:MAG: hypothetical protein LCH39_01185 [Proteobacteria bacterium]|nr:hypothetical protein [Pseudomonadota bacterium]
MTPSVRGLGLAMALGLSAPAAFGQGSEWKTMDYRDLAEKSSDVLQGVFWGAEIADQNAYVSQTLGRDLQGRNAPLVALFQSFDLGVKRIEVSVLSSRKCEGGANHHASGPEPSLCPLKIAISEAGRTRIVAEGIGCFVEAPERGATPVHQQDAIQVQFDSAQGVLKMRCLVGGRWAPECTRNFVLPR